MKFSSALIVSLGVFVASCYAKCNCAASDQPCMDKCVLAANSCIVKCENTGGDSCQQACILSNWPSMAVAKDVLADATSVAVTTTGTGAVATGVLTTGSVSGSILPTSAASVSEFVSTYSTTLSGGSVSLVTSTIKPSAAVSSGGLPRSSSAPSPKMDNSNTSNAVRQQVLSAVTVGAIMASVAWIL